MKDKLKVAVAQVDVKLFDMEANIQKIKDSVQSACIKEKPDIIVFPELSSTGYIKGRDKEFGLKYIKCADKIPGKFTNALGDIAKTFGVYLVSGMCEAHPVIPGALYNSAVVINPEGEIAGIHRKVHIPGYEKHYFIPADTNDVIHTDIGTIGLGICYDNQFPELTRNYALKGAEILVMLWNMPSFSNEGSILHNLTSVRAFENRMYAVSCNRVGENNDIKFFGYSAVSDPLGRLIASANEEETILFATLDNNMILRERAQMPIFRDRRPDLYGKLIEPL